MPRSATSVGFERSPRGLLSWQPKNRESNKRQRAGADKPSLLWIDDYKLGLELYRVMFERLGFRVLTASTGEEGLKIARANHVDIAVTDYEMSGMNGEAVTLAIKAVDPEIPVVLFSGSTLLPARVRRLADACCDKAGSRDQLCSTIFRVLHNKRSSSLQPQPRHGASDVGRRTVA